MKRFVGQAMRDAGYVFWDQRRIDACHLFEEDIWRPWGEYEVPDLTQEELIQFGFLD
jgi:hypothetical protein